MYRIISALVAFGIVAKIAHRIHQKYKNRKDICEVLFTNPSSKCCSGLNDAKPCSNAYCIKRCTARIIHYIDLATEGICIAMNIFTYQPIFDALCQAQRRGVAVRVIFDNTMAKMTESKSKLLEENHIEVRLFNNGNDRSMHHKFCLIDVDINSWFGSGKDIFINGSLNWTMNAFTKNWENFFISSDRDAAKQLQQEFESLWQLSTRVHRSSK